MQRMLLTELPRYISPGAPWGNYAPQICIPHKMMKKEQLFQRRYRSYPKSLCLFPIWSNSLFLSFCVALFYFINFDTENRFYTDINKYNKILGKINDEMRKTNSENKYLFAYLFIYSFIYLQFCQVAGRNTKGHKSLTRPNYLKSCFDLSAGTSYVRPPAPHDWFKKLAPFFLIQSEDSFSTRFPALRVSHSSYMYLLQYSSSPSALHCIFVVSCYYALSRVCWI